MIIPVSIAIPCYNSEKTVERCVDSINRSTHLPSEIIISYDKSTDRTWDILKSLSLKYDNIVLTENCGVSGPAGNRNNAIYHCKYDIITHVDADDTISKYKLEKEYELFLKGFRVAFSDYQIIFPLLCLGSRVNFREFDIAMKTNKLGSYHLFHRTFGVPRDLMFYKSDFHEIGGFDEKLEMFEDLDFKIKLLTKTNNWGYTNTVGTNYFQINSSLSHSSFVKKTLCLSKIQRNHDIMIDVSRKNNFSKLQKSYLSFFLTKLGIFK